MKCSISCCTSYIDIRPQTTDLFYFHFKHIFDKKTLIHMYAFWLKLFVSLLSANSMEGLISFRERCSFIHCIFTICSCIHNEHCQLSIVGLICVFVSRNETGDVLWVFTNESFNEMGCLMDCVTRWRFVIPILARTRSNSVNTRLEQQSVRFHLMAQISECSH